MIGEISALTAAIGWAGNTVIVKSLTKRFSAASLNALRCISASLFFVTVLLISRKVTQLESVSLFSVALLAGSALVGIALGDTLYIRCLSRMDICQAFPIGMSSYPVFTLILAIFFLGEAITFINVAGALLVVLGVSLLVSSQGGWQVGIGGLVRGKKTGIALIVVAAACWAVAVSMLKIGLHEVDIVVANAIRMPPTALLLASLAFMQRASTRDSAPNLGGLWSEVRDNGRGPLALAATSGVIGYGIGGLLFLFAVQIAGAAKAAILSSTSPLFAAPLSILLLKERVTPGVVVGTILCVAGISLVLY